MCHVRLQSIHFRFPVLEQLSYFVLRVWSGEKVLGPLHGFLGVLDCVLLGRLDFLFRSSGNGRSGSEREVGSLDDSIQGPRLEFGREAEEGGVEEEPSTVLVQRVGWESCRFGRHDENCPLALVPFVDIHESQTLTLVLLNLNKKETMYVFALY